MYKYLLFVLSLVVIVSCEKSDALEDHLFGTWDLEWKQCGIYHNSYDAQINFTDTDTTDFGWYYLKGEDTVTFDVRIINNESVELSNTSNVNWNGNLNILEYSAKRLIFERPEKACDNEKFRFK